LNDPERARVAGIRVVSRYVHIVAEDAKDVLQRMNKRILSTIKGS